MKTPDEIKKGLECCIGDCLSYHCRECPYYENNFCETDGMDLCEDALAYIQQLERERDALLEAMKDTDINCDYCKHSDIMQNVCKCDCSFCDIPADDCHCNECRNNSHWEWAGIKEDK